MISNKLIEKSISGTSAKHLVDSLVEDLPSLPALYGYIRKDLPRDTAVRIEDNVVFITVKSNSSRVSEQIKFLELVYPELEFVVG